MIIIIDTETNGLPNYNERARHPSQPHIVQLAWMTMDDAGNVLEKYNQIMKPDGWEISPELSAIHGITQEHALKVGVSEKEACALLLEKIKQASEVIAFNVTFDKFIARIGMRRFDLMTDDDDAWWKAMPTFCCMRPMTNLCKLPHKNGGKGFKFPKLQEAYVHAFNKEFDGAHDALNDLNACKELYFWIKARG